MVQHPHESQTHGRQTSTSKESNFSESLAPNSFELMDQVKQREARFRKTAQFFLGGVSRQIMKT